MLNSANHAYLLKGNKVNIMTDFETMSDNLVRDIESARPLIDKAKESFARIFSQVL